MKVQGLKERMMNKEQCCCFEFVGDNDQCPVHGQETASEEKKIIEIEVPTLMRR